MDKLTKKNVDKIIKWIHNIHIVLVYKVRFSNIPNTGIAGELGNGRSSKVRRRTVKVMLEDKPDMRVSILTQKNTQSRQLTC